MKCPKCGFNSFEYYDSCKKCSADLTGYKQTYSIASLVLPLEAREKLGGRFLSPETVTDGIGQPPETDSDIFSFDLPEDTPSEAAQQSYDPFNSDEPPSISGQSESLSSSNDIFADFLESTSNATESVFAESQTVPGADSSVASLTNAASTDAGAELSAPDFFEPETKAAKINGTQETVNDVFSFDVSPDIEPEAGQQNLDPFKMDLPPLNTEKPGALDSDDVFADFLESTTLPETTASSSPQSTAEADADKVESNATDPTSEPGEFDFESFSWDDSTTSDAPSDSSDVSANVDGTGEPTDDLESIFGDLKESASK